MLKDLRHLPVAGAHNVRDLGGYRTAGGVILPWRRFLRADSLHRIAPGELDRLAGEGIGTVIDLRTVLGLPPSEVGRDTRNLIVHSQGEAIGLWVDRISDILTVKVDDICTPPANVDGIDGKFFQGVHAMKDNIVVLLDVEAVLADQD